MSDGLPYLSISFVVAMKGPITLEVTFMLALNLGNKLTFHGVHSQVLALFCPSVLFRPMYIHSVR